MIEKYKIKDGICVHHTDDRAYLKINDFLKSNIINNCLIVCIGTDRFIGDSLGPLTGTLLSKLELQIPIFGTLENPIHAVNLRRAMTQINNSYKNHKIIAIDACLGSSKSVGYIHVKEGSIQPGKGVGKSLSKVGDYSIIGVVDEAVESGDSEYENYIRINNVRLGLVMKMSETIAKGIYAAFRQ